MITSEQVCVVDEAIGRERFVEVTELMGAEPVAFEALVADVIGELHRVDKVDLKVQQLEQTAEWPRQVSSEGKQQWADAHYLQREDSCPVAHVAVDHVGLNG